MVHARKRRLLRALASCVLASTLSSTGGLLATVLPDWDLATIVEQSDVVVRGTVTEVVILNVDGQLKTHVHVAVDETMLGKQRTAIVVDQHGGSRGGRTAVTSRVQGDVVLQEGDRVVLALFKTPKDAAQARLSIVGLALGAWKLDDDDDDALVQDITVPLARDDGMRIDAPRRRVQSLAELRALTEAAREKRIGKRRGSSNAPALTADDEPQIDPASAYARGVSDVDRAADESDAGLACTSTNALGPGCDPPHEKSP
jgi:hypothetical protein